MNLIDHTTYQHHSATVHSSILALQPTNGTDYSAAKFRREREMIAVNVHYGRGPFEGMK